MFVCVPVLLMLGTVALAEPVFGRITKIEDGKITASVGKKGEREDKTFSYDAKKLKVFKGVGFNKKEKKAEKEDSTLDALKKAVEGGKGKFKGTFAILEVEDGKVSEVTFFQFRKKGKKKPDDATE
jgi:hypothetical protein